MGKEGDVLLSVLDVYRYWLVLGSGVIIRRIKSLQAANTSCKHTYRVRRVGLWIRSEGFEGLPVLDASLPVVRTYNDGCSEGVAQAADLGRNIL